MKYEPLIRISIFFAVLTTFGVWELIRPRRKLTQKKSIRWLRNLGFLALNASLVRILFPLSAVGFALFVQKNSWGLFNNVNVSFSYAVLISIVSLDLVIYWQHVLFHSVPILWRLHRLHHADLDLDVTTGGRFHPIEILISMGIKCFTITLLGTPAAAVLIFEVLLNATSMFNHGNIYIAEKVDQFLRCVVVTPDMHRIHHSIHPEETNSNFGFNLPWWDRIFRTYRKEPKDGQLGMTLGIDG